jgi:aromatic ring-opening dioxygenase LigB subunit
VKFQQKAAVLSVMLLAGCGTNPFKGEFTNRVSMTLGGDEAHVSSMYGPIGITSKVDPKDAEILRELMKLRGMVEAIQRAQAQAQKQPL